MFTRASVAALALALGACNEASGGAPVAGAASSVAASASAAPASPTASAPKVPSSKPEAKGKLEILKLKFTSKIENKEPADTLEAARAGERVWAHVTVRNRTGAERKLVAVFRVGDEVRSRVDLSIAESWSYRTWAYATLRPKDTGKLELTIEDENGDVITEKSMPIR